MKRNRAVFAVFVQATPALLDVPLQVPKAGFCGEVAAHAVADRGDAAATFICTQAGVHTPTATKEAKKKVALASRLKIQKQAEPSR